jgi:uncharacterized protein (TIGR03067 family)
MTRNLLLVAALLGAATFGGAASARDGGRSPENGEATTGGGDSLRGAWVIDFIEVMGQKVGKPAVDQVLTFTGDGKVTMNDGMRNETGSYKVNEAKRPREIDLTTPKGGPPNPPETMPGIYEIQGDVMRIGFAIGGPAAPRPSGFEGKEVVIVVLKRKK